MSYDRMPPVGHTDERGNWHWGSPADRLARIAWEETRRMQAGADERARQEPVQGGETGRIQSRQW